MSKSAGFRTIAENSTDLIARFDRELRHVYVNKAVEEATGIKAKRFILGTTTDITKYKKIEQSREAMCGSEVSFQEMVINLLQNACQTLPNSSQAIRILTSYDKQHRVVMLQVGDEREGIRADDLARIVDPFYSTKREKGGTGLGLSVSSTIIKEHKGSLDFDSRLGRGTTVTVNLPVLPSPPVKGEQ